MRGVRLIVARGELDGEIGFAMRGADTSHPEFMADSAGVLIAHDILEHVNGAAEIGSVWDELEALGAIYFVRGQFGDLLFDRPSMHPIHVNLASDITRMFPQWCEENYNGPRIKKSYRFRDRDIEAAFARALDTARADIPREHPHEGQGTLREYRNAVSDYLRHARERMRLGYRKARRRYRFIGAMGAHDQFRAIRDAIRDARNRYELLEGEEYILAYGSARAHVRAIWEEGYE